MEIETSFGLYSTKFYGKDLEEKEVEESDELDYDVDLLVKVLQESAIEQTANSRACSQGCSQERCSRQCGSGPCTQNCSAACSNHRCGTQSVCCSGNYC